MKKSFIILAALAVAVVAVGASSATAQPPIQVDFVKHAPDPAVFVFEGSVAGAVTGSLASHLVTLNAVTGPIYHVTFEWNVTAGTKSFTADTSGTWNTLTGAVVMNGRVVAGYLKGAQVHEEGQLLDPASLTFGGFLRLLPGTAE